MKTYHLPYLFPLTIDDLLHFCNFHRNFRERQKQVLQGVSAFSKNNASFKVSLAKPWRIRHFIPWIICVLMQKHHLLALT